MRHPRLHTPSDQVSRGPRCSRDNPPQGLNECRKTQIERSIILCSNIFRSVLVKLDLRTGQGPKVQQRPCFLIGVGSKHSKQPTWSSWRRQNLETAGRHGHHHRHRQCPRGQSDWPLCRRWPCRWWAPADGAWVVPCARRAGHTRRHPNRSCCPCISWKRRQPKSSVSSGHHTCARLIMQLLANIALCTELVLM